MRFKAVTLFALATFLAASVFADEAPESVVEEPKEDPALEAEFAYVEALIQAMYPDLAAPVIDETKKKWPESEARFFALEVRGLLAQGQFEAAEKKIASLPDRKSTKYWAARLEMANSYYGRGQKDECMKIYEEFFKAFPNPPKDIRKFYVNASYAYGQLLSMDSRYEKAVERYESLLKMIKDIDEWCNLACETCDLYLKLIDRTTGDAKLKGDRDRYIAAANKILSKLLWQNGRPVFFGRAISMKAHIEQMKGDVNRASELIEEYKPTLQEIHDQILAADPDGSQGFVKISPLPQCLYIQAKMLFEEAKKEFAKPKHDDEKVKTLMFGPKKKDSTKRQTAKGAFAIAQNVFLSFETSSWAPQAGELTEEIRKFAVEKYNANIKSKVTPEQIAKVRKAQFRDANEKFSQGLYREAVAAYLSVLEKYPEFADSIPAIEHMVEALLDLSVEEKDEAARDEARMNADAIEGYLAERFSDARDNLIMIAAGDSLTRLAAKEAERKNYARADYLYSELCANYTRHANVPNVAAGRAGELEKNGRISDAIKYWGLIAEKYTNSTHYALSLYKMSDCSKKLGDGQGEIDWITRYLKVEKGRVRRLQAQMQLAQMYQKRGLDMLEASATNETAEAIASAEKLATAQIIRAIQNFKAFSTEAGEAIQDPGTPSGDKESFNKLRDAALFLAGECWSRMKRPEEKLPMYRENAAKCYNEYLAAYPMGKYATTAYVKLGTIYTALGDITKAKDALDTLSKKFPDSDDAKNAKPRLAKSLIDIGMRKEGTEIYAEMLRTDGAYTPLQFLNAGDALVDARSWDYAYQAYNKAISLAGTNSVALIARARLGIARTSWKQGSLAEAREALDEFLADKTMSRMAIAAEANFMLVDVASQQGKTERDETLRSKHFGAAVGALKKVKQYWKTKPKWEQDSLSLLSGDVLVNRMNAEETMGLKDKALETCGVAAAAFLAFIQSNGPTEAVPLDKMEAGEVDNLERAYASYIKLVVKKGAEQADDVLKYGRKYLDLFPNGKSKAEVENCMTQASAEVSSATRQPQAAPAPAAATETVE